MLPPPLLARRPALAFVLVTVVLDMIAMGMIIPVLPHLVLDFEGGDTASSARMVGIFGTAWAMMQLVASPVLGALSDRFGRRPVILISNLGLGLDYILMALAPSIWWLLVGRIVSGITAASVSTASAYIADVTPAETRAAGFGLLGVGFGLGFVMGPALGGLLGGMDPRLPFWVAAVLSLTNACYGYFVLPESLPPERRAPFRWRRASPIGALRMLGRDAGIGALAGVMFLSSLAHIVLPSTFVLYAAHRYAWGEREVGLTLAGVGLSAALVQGLLVKPIVRTLGERRTLFIGLAAGVVGFAIYGLAPNPMVFLAGVPVMAVWGLASPSVQGLMTSRVAPDEQGRLQGAVSSLMGVGALIGPLLFTQSFAVAIGPAQTLGLPGAPFLLASAMLLLALVLALRARRPASVGTGALVDRKAADA
jgi:DHA1 family tetracycline resistance protein-like MFS transporter